MWLGDNGGVMMGMITRVEKMVMQSSVKPVIEKLHGTNMHQGSYNDTINPPKRQVMSLCELQVCDVERYPIKYDLIIPTKNNPTLITHLMYNLFCIFFFALLDPFRHC